MSNDRKVRAKSDFKRSTLEALQAWNIKIEPRRSKAAFEIVKPIILEALQSCSVKIESTAVSFVNEPLLANDEQTIDKLCLEHTVSIKAHSDAIEFIVPARFKVSGRFLLDAKSSEVSSIHVLDNRKPFRLGHKLYSTDHGLGGCNLLIKDNAVIDSFNRALGLDYIGCEVVLNHNYDFGEGHSSLDDKNTPDYYFWRNVVKLFEKSIGQRVTASNLTIFKSLDSQNHEATIKALQAFNRITEPLAIPYDVKPLSSEVIQKEVHQNFISPMLRGMNGKYKTKLADDGIVYMADIDTKKEQPINNYLTLEDTPDLHNFIMSGGVAILDIWCLSVSWISEVHYNEMQEHKKATADFDELTYKWRDLFAKVGDSKDPYYIAKEAEQVEKARVAKQRKDNLPKHLDNLG